MGEHKHPRARFDGLHPPRKEETARPQGHGTGKPKQATDERKDNTTADAEKEERPGLVPTAWRP